ncbi:hypothetical protein AB0M29_00380 [Streptomyces sp. NPDC051976]|uniref:hypothetical protein n=1 Tax=Streptomyces sp. NPDC051976 TaxID=3154947 RepID=UPI003419275B
MWSKIQQNGQIIFTVTAATTAALALAGCAAGQGAPEGWRYLKAGEVAVAHPKNWHEVRSGAELRGPAGRIDAGLTVSARAGSAGSPARADAVPASARSETLDFDGRAGRVFSFAQPEPGPTGRPASHVEVRFRDTRDRTVIVRAWAADGAADPLVLREIVNSIEFS